VGRIREYTLLEIFVLTLVLAFFGSVFWVRRLERLDWNNGWCSECGILWKPFDMASDNSIGYKCGCPRYIWK